MQNHRGIELHETLADGWDSRYKAGTFLKRSKFFIDQIIPLLNSNGCWLDLGCGSGYFSRLLNERGACVEGVDGSAEMVRNAKKLSMSVKNASQSLLFKTVQSLEELDYSNGSFDGVICLSVLEYLSHPEKCFGEIVRVLRPGGKLVVSVPNRRSLVRNMLKLYNKIAEDSQLKYLEVSNHAWIRGELDILSRKYSLTDVALLSFDPFFPSSMLGTNFASLIFLVAEKSV